MTESRLYGATIAFECSKMKAKILELSKMALFQVDTSLFSNICTINSIMIVKYTCVHSVLIYAVIVDIYAQNTLESSLFPLNICFVQKNDVSFNRKLLVCR